jgi:non-homologous end joining protein Ku
MIVSCCTACLLAYSKILEENMLNHDTDAYRLIAQRLEEEKVLAMTKMVLQTLQS